MFGKRCFAPMIHGLFHSILINHSDPACVTLCAGKFRIKERIDNLHCKSCSRHTRTHCQNIGIVVQTGSLSTEAISADSRTNPFIAVGCNGNADTGATDQNTSIASSLLNLFYYFLCVHRIVYRIL